MSCCAYSHLLYYSCPNWRVRIMMSLIKTWACWDEQRVASNHHHQSISVHEAKAVVVEDEQLKKKRREKKVIFPPKKHLCWKLRTTSQSNGFFPKIPPPPILLISRSPSGDHKVTRRFNPLLVRLGLFWKMYDTFPMGNILEASWKAAQAVLDDFFQSGLLCCSPPPQGGTQPSWRCAMKSLNAFIFMRMQKKSKLNSIFVFTLLTI